MALLRKNSLTKNFVKDRYIYILFFVFLLLRLYRLGYHDFWYDEIASIDYTLNPWGHWNAPLYWMFMHAWIKLFPISEFSFRLPSVFFNFFSVVAVYVLGKHIFNKTTGLYAAVFMGFSSFHLWYAQEARDYSMVLFFSIISTGLFYLAIKKDDLRLWVFFIISSLAALYSNYFQGFLIISQGFFLLLNKRKNINIRALMSFLIVSLGFSVYLGRFFDKFHIVQEGFWVKKPQLLSLGITFENFLLGYNGNAILYLIADICIAVLLIQLLHIVLKKQYSKNVFFCLYMFIIPIILIFVFSRVYFSIYLDRALIIFSPYFYLLLAAGMNFLPLKLKKSIVVLLIFLMSVSIYRYFNELMYPPLMHHQGTYLKKPIKPIVNFLKTEIKDGDIVGFTNQSAFLPITYYMFHDISKIVMYMYDFYDPALVEGCWQRPYIETMTSVPFYKIKKLTFQRLWVLCSDWGRSGQLDENSIAVKKWLDENLLQEFHQEFNGLWIFRYVRKDIGRNFN